MKVFVLRHHQKTNLIEVEVTQILDSRCPQDLVCIWGGQVIVSFKLPTRVIADLCLGSDTNCFSTVEFGFAGERYELLLLDVKPYPTTTNGAEKRTVDFTLIKK